MQLSEKKFLTWMAKDYPTIAAASEEIINLQAILKLPKPTEHFMSDLHGEYEAFTHILSNASGVIREKVERVLADKPDRQTPEQRAELAALIYYPVQKLPVLKERQTDLEQWYRKTLLDLLEVCRVTESKYTRSFVRKRLPKTFAYILDELLHAHFEDHAKEDYYERILSSIIDTGQADDFIIALCELIRRLSVHRLHIVGDIFDRGPRPDIIMDELIAHHAVDIQWGNHDAEWMGAAAGSEVCIASVIHVALSYHDPEMLEDSYGLNLRPLALFAEEVYQNTDVSAFYPKLLGSETLPSRRDFDRTARMHKAITVMLCKLECQVLARNPEFQMEDRALLERIDFTAQSVEVDGVCYRLRDCDFPTVAPACPARLTKEEADVMQKLCRSFRESERLQRHIRFLYAKGGIYKVENQNLLFHGAVPMNEAGGFASVKTRDGWFSGKAWMDYCEKKAREGYFAPENSAARREGQDFLWYLWCGRLSPLFGRHKMSVFEHFFIGEPQAYEEKKNAYYTFIESDDPKQAERAVLRIFEEFGLDAERGHIINGHVPVRAKAGESPLKAGGKLLVIDGGFCKAYQGKTGIAGYTLVSSSRGLSLRSHSPFESLQKAIEQNGDILSVVNVVETSQKRICVEDTDEGARLKEKIQDLRALVQAYRTGVLKETSTEGSV